MKLTFLHKILNRYWMDKMELPEDVLQLVRAYAKPRFVYFREYKRALSILKLRLWSDTRMKLKTAFRFHFETFLQLFLVLERTHAELTVAVDAYMSSRPLTSELQMEYYRKRQNYTFNECAFMNRIHNLWCTLGWYVIQYAWLYNLFLWTSRVMSNE